MQLGLKAAEPLDDLSSDAPDTILRSLAEGGIPVVPAAHLGERLGAYRILETLGEGGMGIVYLAEQEQPFRRRVALKVIKLGMDTREVVARFEGERQALAMMSHSHIAQIYGAGVTDDGRPYFVMEYVPGIPITEYCDQSELPTRTRLELFVLVCGAIEHAHQKGIIHRDIKPHNILVTVQDSRPVPKVIDFGVAKATRQQLTEKTVFTHLGLLIGTPEYMSPEQAELGSVEITKATDIYSLGVLFYELLVSTLPFDPTVLRRAGYADIQRVIREEEPVPPSTRLTDLGEKAQDVAQRRRTDPSTLARQLKGDLDWIALKALEKQPAKRYPSAAALAADISRHLSSERVLARPSSIPARVRRFAKRHPLRSRVIAAAVAIGLVIGGASIRTWIRSGGVPLTMARPVGGTIIGGGLVCGTHGAVCSMERPRGEAIELLPVPDKEFVFGGFTGDCTSSGKVTMGGARACAATFRKAGPIGPQLTRRLAIDKPVGGTLVSAGGILCGTLGSLCTAHLPDGAPVALKAVADSGHQFSQFTGTCAGRCETFMTVDRACGAIFTRVEDRPLASRQTTSPLPSTPPATTTVSAPLPLTPPATTTVSAPLPLTPPATTTVSAGTSAPVPSGTGQENPAGREIAATTVAPSASISESEARQVIEAYYAAYRAKDFKALRKVFPDAPDLDQKRIEVLRKDSERCDYIVWGLRVGPVKASRARATIDVTQFCRPRIGAPARKGSERLTFWLGTGADGRWIITRGPEARPPYSEASVKAYQDSERDAEARREAYEARKEELDRYWRKGVEAPVVVSRVEPIYPEAAKSAGATGTVVLEAIVDSSGNLKRLTVVESAPLFDEAAVAAVRQFKFKSATELGKPVEGRLLIPVFFW
jgi:TonB family protein